MASNQFPSTLIYHAAHRDYTYSQDWVTFLVGKLKNDGEWDKLVHFVPKNG